MLHSSFYGGLLQRWFAFQYKQDYSFPGFTFFKKSGVLFQSDIGREIWCFYEPIQKFGIFRGQIDRGTKVILII